MSAKHLYRGSIPLRASFIIGGNKENREIRNPGPEKPDSRLLRNAAWVIGMVGVSAAGISREPTTTGVAVGLFSIAGAFLDLNVQIENSIGRKTKK